MEVEAIASYICLTIKDNKNSKQMKLSNKAIQEIKASKRLRNRLALDLDIAAGTLNRWVASNDDSLTKAKCLQIIREETGLTDSEILEETVAA